MKKLIPSEPHRLIFPCFFVALSYILLYEFVFTSYPSSSETAYKIGVITSRLIYSFIAACIFYYVSIYLPVYLPKQRRKRKILFNVFQKTLIIESFMSGLMLNLNIHGNDFQNNQKFKEIISSINPDKPIDQFENWHFYFYFLKTRLIDVIRSMTFYNDYLSEDFLHELILLEKQLLHPHTFEGYKTLVSSDLSYAEIDIQELLIHNKHLQELREKEFKKYEKDFTKDGSAYRNKYYDKIPKQ